MCACSVSPADAAEVDAVAAIALVDGHEPVAGLVDTEAVLAEAQTALVPAAGERGPRRHALGVAAGEDGHGDVRAVAIVVPAELADGPRRHAVVVVILVRRDGGRDGDAGDGRTGDGGVAARVALADAEVRRTAAIDPHAAVVVPPVVPEAAPRARPLPGQRDVAVGVDAAEAVPVVTALAGDGLVCPCGHGEGEHEGGDEAAAGSGGLAHGVS